MDNLDRIIKENIHKLVCETSYGYHSGDLGKSHADGLYGLTRSRNTGHFGSGTYFFGNKGDAEKYGKHDKPNPRQVHEVDFDQYHLFKPKNKEDGMKLHDFLRELNSDYVRYPEGAPLSVEEFTRKMEWLSRFKNKYSAWGNVQQVPKNEFMHFIKVAKTLEDCSYWAMYHDRVDGIVERYLRNGWSRNEIIEDVFNHLKEHNIYDELIRFLNFPQKWERFLFKLFWVDYNQIRDLIQSCRDYYISHDYKRDEKSITDPYYKQHSRQYLEWAVDSASTFFMKQLGYNGIDVRGYDNLDNGMYGSVIYDLNKGKN